MNKSMMVVELWEIVNVAQKQGYSVEFLSKGAPYDREGLNFKDAREFVKYDIVILEGTQKKAEELRKMMEPFKEKETVICWCSWNDFWCEKGGEYQVTTINESFCSSKINEITNLNFDGLIVACEKFNTLSGIALENMTTQVETVKIKGKY